MRVIQLTKQAAKKLKELKKSNPKIAKNISEKILNLKFDDNVLLAESLQGHSEFKKIRVSKYRIIYTFNADTVTVAIVEKRETVYQTFANHLKNSNFNR